MKRSAVLFIVAVQLLLWAGRAYGQVWNGDLVFTSQSQIDDFGFFGYSSVNGKLRIYDAGDGQHNITNLAGLAGLTSVTGALEILNNNLLANTIYLNLTSVGSVLISGNTALTTINGLPVTNTPIAINIEQNNTLVSVTSFSAVTILAKLVIRNNPLLTNLSGFSNLTKVTDSLSIISNNSITQLNVFSHVTEARYLSIQNNPALTNISGLSAFTKVTSFLEISNNTLLTNIDALINLTSVNAVVIYDNPALLNINGISNVVFTSNDALFIATNNALQTITGAAGWTRMAILNIQGNPALTSISGFNALKYLGYLDIVGNPALVNVSAFNALDTISGNLRFEKNNHLTTLNGLQNLKYVAGNFTHRENYVLSSIAPMPLLDSISGNFILLSDSMLTNVDFIPNLKRIGGDVFISTCKRLANLNGLSNLTSIRTGLLLIEKCPQLTSISGLGGLTRIAQSLTIAELGITNLHGLHNITKTGFTFSIRSNLQLTSLNALTSLDTVVGSLLITSNPLITNLNGVRNLKAAQGINVGLNTSLTQFCGLYRVLSGSNPPAYVVGMNAANPTAQEIINAGPCTSAQLPVTLKLFNSHCERNKVVLNWITAAEYNNSHFVLQRSVNGSIWQDLGTVSATGNSSGEHTYSFIDDIPQPNAFYRLAQYDIDGKVNYSPILRSTCGVQKEFILWPNPATDKIILSLYSSTASTEIVRVYDGKGVLVISKSLVLLPGINQVEVNISKVPPGAYIVMVTGNEGAKTKAFVKQ